MKRIRVSRRQGFIICIIFVVGVSALAVWGVAKKTGHQDEPVLSYYGLCHEDELGAELKSEYPHFGSEQAAGMSDIIQRITDLPGHRQSVNCLFVLGRYNAYMGFNSRAVDYYDELMRLYDQEGVWVDVSISREQPDDLRGARDFLKKEQERFIGIFGDPRQSESPEEEGPAQ